MKGPRLRACLVGCGRMGASIDDELPESLAAWRPMSHAAALAACSRVELIAVCARSGERVEAVRERYRVPRGHVDVEHMLAAERPDLLCIATPADTHASIIEAAAAHGVRAVYCEKPLAPSLADADRIAVACRLAGIKLGYGTQRRYMEPWVSIRRALAEGRLGEPVAVTVTSTPTRAFAMHSHSVDLLSFLSGDAAAVSVMAALELDESDAGIEDPVVHSAYVRFANGIHGYLETGIGYEVEVRTDAAILRVVDNGARVVLRRTALSGSSVDTPFEHPPITSGTLAGIEDLVRALDEDRPTSAEIASRGLEVLFAMVASERRGGARVDPRTVDRQLRLVG